MPFLTRFFFGWEGSPKTDYRKKLVPDSTLSTGGPRTWPGCAREEESLPFLDVA